MSDLDQANLAELEGDQARLWEAIDDANKLRVAGDSATSNEIKGVENNTHVNASGLSQEVIDREKGDLRQQELYELLNADLSRFNLDLGTRITNLLSEHETDITALDQRVTDAVNQFAHIEYVLTSSINQERTDRITQYNALDTRVKKYEQMLSDITMDSNRITMDNGEIQLGAWTILSQARKWDLDIIRMLQEKASIIDEELQKAIDDLTNQMPNIKDIIDKAIEDLSNAPIVKEMDELLGGAIKDIDDLQIKQAQESIDRANEIIALNQKYADDLIAKAQELQAMLLAEASQRAEDIAREAQIRAQQIIDEATDRNDQIVAEVETLNAKIADEARKSAAAIIAEAEARSAEIQAKAQELLSKIDSETAGRIEAIELLQDGLTKEIQFRKDGDTATLTALDNYKVSTNSTLANIQDRLTIVADESSATANRVTALDARIGTVDTKAGQALSAAATAQQTANAAVSANQATAEQVNAVSASLRTAVNLLIAAYSNPNNKKRTAEGWTYVPNGLTVSDSAKSATTNGNCFTITYPTTTNNGWITARNNARTDWDSFPIPLEEGKKYLISLYVKTSVANTMNILFQQRNPNGSTTNIPVLRVANNASTFDTTTTLTRVTFYTTQAVPANVMQGRMVMQFNGKAVAGTVATVERMMIEEMLLNPKEASPWVPGPEDPTLAGDYMEATGQAVTQLKADVKKNGDDITIVSNAMTVVQADLVDTKSKVAANASSIATNAAEIVKTKDSITQVASAQTVITNRLTIAENNITVNANAITGIDSRLKVTEGQITSTIQDVTLLKNQVKTAQDGVDANQQALEATKLDVKANKDNITAITQRTVLLENNVTALQRDIANAATTQALQELKGQVDIIDGKVTATASSLTLLETKVNNVDSKANNAISSAATAQQTANTAVTAAQAAATATTQLGVALSNGIGTNLIKAQYSDPFSKLANGSDGPYTFGGASTITMVDSEIRTGKAYSMKSTVASDGTNVFKYLGVFQTADWKNAPIRIEDGKQYTISFFAKALGTAAIPVWVALRAYDDTGTYGANIPSYVLDSTPESMYVNVTTDKFNRYTFYVKGVDLKKTLRTADLLLRFGSGVPVGGTVVFDQLMVEERIGTTPKPASPWVPGVMDNFAVTSTFDAQASLIQTNVTKIDQVDGKVTINTNAITKLQGDLATTNLEVAKKATIAAMDALSGTVSDQGDKLTVVTNRITNMEAGVATTLTGISISAEQDIDKAFTYWRKTGEVTKAQSNEGMGNQIITIGNNNGNDNVWMHANNFMPFDPNRIYKLRAKIRRVTGSGTIYLGIACKDINKVNYVTTSNTLAADMGSAVYTLSASAPSLGVWMEYEFYIKGRAAGAAVINNSSLATPTQLPNQTAWISPMLIANYSASAGQVEVAYVVLESAEPYAAINANAQAVATLNATVVQQGGNITSMSTDIVLLKNRATTIEGDLATKASSTALNQTNSEVSRIDGVVISQGQNIVNLSNTVTQNKNIQDQTEILTRLMSQGKALRSDPTFKLGNNLVPYINQAGSTYIRQAKSADNPVESTHEILIRSTAALGSGWLPGAPNLSANANKTFFIKQIVKVPVGLKLQPYGNSVGTGGYLRMFGNVEGTGKFEVYYSVVQCGPDATTTIQGHFRPINSTVNTPPVASTSAPVDVIVASYEVWDVTAINDVIPKEWSDKITATADAVTTLDNKVTGIDGRVTSASNSITQLQNSINTINGTLENKADSSALGSLSSKVDTIDGKVTTNASSITALSGRVSTVEGNASTALTNAATAQQTANTAVSAAAANAQSISDINTKYGAIPNVGVNLLSGTVSNPMYKPVFTAGHIFDVDRSFETKDTGRYVITPQVSSGAGIYFNEGGQSPLRLTLPPGDYVFSFYAKFTGTPTTFATDWVMYGVAATAYRFNITKNLVRYSVKFTVPTGGRSFCPLSMTNPLAVAADQNIVMYLERLMVERVATTLADPSVWVEGTIGAAFEVAQSEARVTTTVKTVSDAQKATADQVTILQSSFNNMLTPGKNILKASNVELVRASGAYNIGFYQTGYNLVAGKVYTLVYCSTHIRASGDTSSVIDAWVDSSQKLGVDNSGGTRVIKKITFTRAAGANAGAAIGFYCWPSGSNAATQSTVHWAVLLEGETQGVADWFQSPYDVEGLITATDAKITALAKTVADNNTAAATRMDTLQTNINSVNTSLGGRITTLSDSFTSYKDTTNLALTQITSRMDNVESGLTTTNTAQNQLKGRIEIAEGKITNNASALTVVQAGLSGLDSDSLIRDYNMKVPEQWFSHYGYDMKQYFKTTTTGKVGNTVFRKDTTNPVNCFNYNFDSVPNDRTYKISFWVRCSADSNGSLSIPVELGYADGLWTTSRYTAFSVPAGMMPTKDGNWYFVSVLANLTANTTAQQLRFGIAPGHTGSTGWWEVQGYKVSPVLTTGDMDSTVASAIALNALSADVKKVDDRVTVVASSVTQLKSEIIVPNNNLLRNGNFIAMTGARATYWADWGTTNAVRTVETINGKQWLHIVANNTAIFRGISQSTSANAFKRKTEYTVSFNAYSVAATGGVQLLIHQSGGGNNDPQITPVAFPITNVNKRYSFTFTSADLDTKSAFNFMIGPQNGVAGDLYITDIMFGEGNVAAGWNASADEVNTNLAANAQAITDTRTYAEQVDGRVTTVAQTTTQLQSDVGTNSAKLILQGQVIDGIKGEYAVKIDVNGLVTGFGLINNGTTSAFAVNADFFYIGKPSNAKKPFIVTTSPQTINGVTYPAGTWIDVAFIANATIGTAHIQDAAITNAKIASLDAAKITTGILNAARVRVGPTSSFDSGYDPAANLQTAKDYVDITPITGGGKIFNLPATLRTGVSSLSTMVIHTPITLNAYMNMIEISGYNYTAAVGNNFKISLGFYAYTSGNPFPNPRVNVSGIDLASVILAVDSANKVCILITPKSSWSYPQMTVDKATIMHTAPPDSFKSGWSITQESDVSGYTSKINVPIDASETEAGAQAKASAVQAKVDEFSTDGILTSPEKKQVRVLKDEINAEKPTYILNASAMGVNSAAYANAYDALSVYLAPLLTNLNVNSTIVRTTFQTTFATYYDERTKLIKAINDAIKAVGDLAQNTANSKSRTFITQPIVPYSAGDIWKSGTSTFVSTVTRTTGAFTTADWTKVGDVTSENTAADSAKLGGTAASTVVNNAATGAAAASTVNGWKFTGTTEIDGGKIRADTITAVQLNVSELSAISGNLGTLITYKDASQPLKARMVLTGSLITIYDDNNVVRVKMGLW